MSEIKTRETMWATMKPDCYGGKTYDRVVPQWSVYCDGDKQGEDGLRTLTLASRTFPPGTKVTIEEPVCPNCGDIRAMKYPTPKRGPLFEPRCGCGFDWDAWTIREYS